MINVIRTVIVDDEAKSIETIQLAIEKFIDGVEIIGSAQDIDSAFELILESSPDLVLLDINLGRSDGFELLERIPDFDFEVIFITAHDQYAVKAFKVAAVDYLLKPFEVGLLKLAIEKVWKKLGAERNRANVKQFILNVHSNRDEHKIAIPTMNGYDFLRISDTVYCKAEGNYTHLIINKPSEIVVSKPISVFEDLFEEYSFVRIHNSYIINLIYLERYIKGDGGIVILKDKTHLNVSRNRKSDLIRALNIF